MLRPRLFKRFIKSIVQLLNQIHHLHLIQVVSLPNIMSSPLLKNGANLRRAKSTSSVPRSSSLVDTCIQSSPSQSQSAKLAVQAAHVAFHRHPPSTMDTSSKDMMLEAALSDYPIYDEVRVNLIEMTLREMEKRMFKV